MLKRLLPALLLPLLPLAATAQRALWADDARAPGAGRTPASGALRHFRPLTVQLSAVRAALQAAPAEIPTPPAAANPAAAGAGVVIALPRPGGGTERFRVRQVAVMAPALAARFPQIRTYRGFSLDTPGAVARLDVSPAGFHAQVLPATGRAWYLDPVAGGDTVHHRVFYKTDQFSTPLTGWQCQARSAAGAQPKATGAARLETADDEPVVRRTFRLAVACTPEYALTKGNTVAGALAAIVSSVNRVNGVYEKELALRLVLVANNDQLVFLSGTGPQPSPAYTNANGDALLSQNQQNTDRLIGPANYDIGHVFSTGGAGIAFTPAACNNQNKAKGVSGLQNPSGDAFDIDYVAHEMGHQFGAHHTFHSTRQLCGEGNRNPDTAYEPGSGTSIMAYAGICAPENVQLNSDPYFLSVSRDEIRAYVDGPASCGTSTTTANRPPVPVAGPYYFIPKSTPFVLTGTATDPDGDALTYSWEEVDLGAETPIASPSGSAPLFRTFAPVPSPTRYFPQLFDLLTNTQTLGEQLPDYGRRLRFRFVARDNRPDGSGLAYDSTSLAVVATAGPFRVLAPGAGAPAWQAGMPAAVSWDVAGTTAAPISAGRVDILLSLDGGLTYPVVLAAATPNDGAADFSLPPSLPATDRARVMVRATGNVFFGLSNADFTIIGKLATPTLTATSALTSDGATLVNLTWTETSAATFYQLQRAPESPAAYADVAPSQPATAPRTYDDVLTAPGRHFYRLRACNAAGCSDWSADVAVEVSGPSPLSVAPNPSSGQFTVLLTDAQRGPISLNLYDALGRALRAETALKDADAWRYPLDLGSLAGGLYLLRLRLPSGESAVLRLVKH
ncbi:reprolysin-like metallopeptidase [uncultured Hymenobacter sp.]|uniref:reprolysin-like metallopeptidase n=1 Tax=uncultured Hymenobacter sp. TaxID=170016 RepID=UPI0035CC1E24